MGFNNVVTEDIRQSFYRGKKNPCGDWSYRDFWHGDTTKVYCELERGHDDSHMSMGGNHAWSGGFGSGLWFKEAQERSDPQPNKEISND